jgi:hypothetical protein
MKAITAQTSVNYHTTLLNNPEHSHLYVLKTASHRLAANVVGNLTGLWSFFQTGQKYTISLSLTRAVGNVIKQK